MSLVGGGGYAEYAVAYANHPMRIPDSMSFEEAACVCRLLYHGLNVFILGELGDQPVRLAAEGGGGVNTATAAVALQGPRAEHEAHRHGIA